MKLSIKTFLGVAKALPEAVLEDRDARPELFPIINAQVAIPQALQRVTTQPQNASFTEERVYSRAAAQPATLQTFSTLGPGLWRLSGSCWLTATVPAAGPTRHDSLGIFVGASLQHFAVMPRMGSFQNTYFDRTFLIEGTGTLAVNVGATGAGETMDLIVSFSAEKFL